MRHWIDEAIAAVKYFAYFLYLGDHAQGISTIASCLCFARKVHDEKAELTRPTRLLDFMNQQFEWLNELTERHGLEDLNKPVSMLFSKKIKAILGVARENKPTRRSAPKRGSKQKKTK